MRQIVNVSERFNVLVTKKGVVYSFNDENKVRKLRPVLIMGQLEVYHNGLEVFALDKISEKDMYFVAKEDINVHYENDRNIVWQPVAQLGFKREKEIGKEIKQNRKSMFRSFTFF